MKDPLIRQSAVHLLHRHILDLAHAIDLPVMSISASSSAVCKSGSISEFSIAPIELALSHGLIPMIHGDVAFDMERGGTVLSTEELFSFLAAKLSPSLVLLAGIEDGVLTSWPNGSVITSLPAEKESADGEAHIIGSHAADVTGGMRGKLKEARDILHRSSVPCSVVIFSGERPMLTERALLSEEILGTRIGRV